MAMGVGVLLAILTTFQLGVWADTPSLAAHALKVDPGSAVGNYIAGEIASVSGNPRKAEDYFRRSSVIRDIRMCTSIWVMFI